MIERLLAWLDSSWEALKPAVVIPAYDSGVVLRLGTFHRIVGPGLHWKIPIAEDVLTTTTAITTLEMRPQTLTTADNVGIVAAGIIKYEIRDPRPYLLDIWDAVDVLRDVAMGALRTCVIARNWAELASPALEAAVLDIVRKQCNQYGFKLHTFTLTDMGRVRSLRLLVTGEGKNETRKPANE